VISLNTVIGETSGMINICIPHLTLEPIISKLSVHYWMETKSSKNTEEDKDKITSRLEQSKVEVKAILGESTISVDELLNLSINDVVQLNQEIHSPIKLYVQEQPKFLAQLGKKKNKVAVQLLQPMEKGESQ